MAPPPRIVVAVHGREPADWEQGVSRTLGLWPEAEVRIVAVADVPAPRGARLLPSAGRAYAAARADWRRRERDELDRRIRALLEHVPGVPEVVHVEARDADPGRAIADAAAAWGATLVVVGVDRAGLLRRWLLGAAHERLVGRAGCVVVVSPWTVPGDRVAAGPASLRGPGGPRPAAVGGGA